MKKVLLATNRCTGGVQYSSSDRMKYYPTNKEILAKCLFDHNMLGVIEGIGLCTVSNYYGRAIATPLNGGPTYIITMAECSDFILAGGVFITENIGEKK